MGFWVVDVGVLVPFEDKTLSLVLESGLVPLELLEQKPALAAVIGYFLLNPDIEITIDALFDELKARGFRVKKSEVVEAVKTLEQFDLIQKQVVGPVETIKPLLKPAKVEGMMVEESNERIEKVAKLMFGKGKVYLLR